MSGLFRSIGKLLNGGVDPRQQHADVLQQSQARTAELQQRAQTAAAESQQAQGFAAKLSGVLNAVKAPAPPPSRSPDIDAEAKRIEADKRTAGQAMSEAQDRERKKRGRLANITNTKGARGLDESGLKSLRRTLE